LGVPRPSHPKILVTLLMISLIKTKKRAKSVLIVSRRLENFSWSDRSECFGRSAKTSKDCLDLWCLDCRQVIRLHFSNKLKKYNHPAETTIKGPIPNTKTPKIKGFLRHIDFERQEITQRKEPAKPKRFGAKQRSGCHKPTFS